MEHIASVASIDAIALGPDFVDDYYQEIYGGWAIPGMEVTWCDSELRRPSDLPRITEEMAVRGFTDADIRKVLGGNAMRVFDEVMGVPAAAPPP